MSEFKDWIGSIEVTNTLGNGWCVRVDGSDIFDEINQYDVKTRRTFSIRKNLESEEAAKGVAVEWLNRQLKNLGEQSGEIDTITEQVRQLREALECMVLKFAYQDFDTSPLPTNEQQEEVAHAMELLEVTK